MPKAATGQLFTGRPTLDGPTLWIFELSAISTSTDSNSSLPFAYIVSQCFSTSSKPPAQASVAWHPPRAQLPTSYAAMGIGGSAFTRTGENFASESESRTSRAHAVHRLRRDVQTPRLGSCSDSDGGSGTCRSRPSRRSRMTCTYCARSS